MLSDRSHPPDPRRPVLAGPPLASGYATAAGAEMVVTSCQQCVRTMATRARRQKIKLDVKDLTELVYDAMK